ncbi:MAG: hypothetical protein R2800_12470 [Flavipsychrobacter sp.]
MKSYIIAILMIFCGAVSTYGQEELQFPVKNEARIKKTLFHIDHLDKNHFIKVTLPNDNFLLIDFYRMSYWPTPSDLQSVCDIAAGTVDNVSDKFKDQDASKWLGLHVPMNNKPVMVQLKEHNDDGIFVVDGQESAALKIGMDTVQVLKTYKKNTGRNKELEELAQIQYTFVLKDISDMQVIANNKALIADIVHTLDSVVAAKRSRWKKEDIWYHKVGIAYEPMETDKSEKLTVTNRGNGILKGIDVDYYIGASLFRHKLTPNLEMGVSYKFPDNKTEYTYFRASFVTLPQFEQVNTARFDFYNTVSFNAEIGTIINRKVSQVPIYNTSIGFGYIMSDHPSIEPHNMYSMFFHFGVSPAIRVTGNLYLLDMKGQDNQVWSGITVAMRLF